MDIIDDKLDKSDSEQQGEDVGSPTTFKRNIYGLQKTCMYLPNTINTMLFSSIMYCVKV